MDSKLAFFFLFSSFAHAAVLPATTPAQGLAARAEVYRDVIRLAKCSGLLNRDRDEPWERGMAALFEDKDNAKTPIKQAEFDMNHPYDDFFILNTAAYEGNRYEGDYATGDGHIKVEILKKFEINVEHGVWAGTAQRTEGNRVFTYNCFTEKVLDDTFEWNDPNYRTCTTYATCTQNDALRIFVKGSEDVAEAEDLYLAKTAEVLANFDKAYDNSTGICDESPIPIRQNGKCTVSFECSNNAADMGNDGEVMAALRGQLKAFDNEAAYKEHSVTNGEGCNGTPGCIPRQVTRTYLKVPETIVLAAKALPPPQSGRQGYEVAKIKATVHCEDSGMDKGICEAFGMFFSAVGLIPPFTTIGGVGGVATEVGCGLAGVE